MATEINDINEITLIDIAQDRIEQPTWDQLIIQNDAAVQRGSGLSVVGKPLQSPNYIKRSTGWRINSNGDAEFNNIIVRGSSNTVPLSIYQPIDGSVTPVPITIDTDGTAVTADANDSALDDFFGFVTTNATLTEAKLATYLSGTNGGRNSTSFTHVLDAGNNRCIIAVWVGRNTVGNPTKPTAVTWNSLSMTEVGSQVNDRNGLAMWRLVTGTSSTSTSATFTATGASAGLFEEWYIINYENVLQSDPVASFDGTGGAGADTNIQDALTPDQSYSLAVSSCINGDGNSGMNITPPTGHTILSSNTESPGGAIDRCVDQGYHVGIQSHTITHTFPSTSERTSLTLFLNNAAAGDIDVAVSGVMTFAGLTPGADYYLQNTAGTIGTSPGSTSVLLGKALSTTKLLIINI